MSPAVETDPWLSPEWEGAALLTIDVQADFVEGGANPVPGTAAVLPAVAELLAAFRAAGRPVVHVVRMYDGDDVDLVRRGLLATGAPIVRPGSPGAEPPAPMRPTAAPPLDPAMLLSGGFQQWGPAEWVMWKPRWGAFHRTDLEGFLRRHGVTTVVVAGCNFPNCPRATIVQASERDLRVVLATDAMSGLRDWHLAETEGIGVLPLPVHAIAAALPATG
ncbi:cysteine hydrolase family protein [Krasilnikovia sp. M28-CT-15]|uniref:cysteine hydrolase family protein n=1 Tax=Krasilnikovia sp. M28-CT-15 TaxID=3373540 RepID=UPI003876F7E2